MQQPAPDDFVVATGQTCSLEDFVTKVFDFFGLHWRDHVVIQPSLLRPSDIHASRGNPDKAAKILQWSVRNQVDDVVRLMCEDAISQH